MIKGQINKLAVTGAVALAGLQMITPMFVDMMFSGLIIGLMFVASKTDN